MLNQQTIEKLLALKLIGMAEAFKDQMMQPDIDRLSSKNASGLLLTASGFGKKTVVCNVTSNRQN